MARRPASAAPGQPPGGPEPTEPASDPMSVARIVCLRLLERRPHTRGELTAALAQRGVPDAAASAVLDRFTEVGLVDDAAFARSWVESRRRARGLAKSVLAQELRQRGVSPEHVDAALDAVAADDEAATARALVRRKLRSLARVAPEVQTRRLVGMLARKGYGAGLAYRVVREVLGEECPIETDIVGEDDSSVFGES